MGLDMYLDGRKYLSTDYQNPENNPKEDGFEVKERILRIGYWRKHPNLHGYIVATFANGRDECQDIELGSSNIETIIEAVKGGDLPHTQGFFFGESSLTDERRAEDLRILEAAKQWVSTEEEGVLRYLVYRASW